MSEVTAISVTVTASRSGAMPTLVRLTLSNGKLLDVPVAFDAQPEEVLRATANALVAENYPSRQETLNTGLVEVLVKIREAVGKKNTNSVHLQRDLSLTKTEYNNAQKLRFHGLIHHDQAAGAGYWLITRRGAQFLRGELATSESVTVRDNKVVDHSDATVTIGDRLRAGTPRFNDRADYLLGYHWELQEAQMGLGL